MDSSIASLSSSSVTGLGSGHGHKIFCSTSQNIFLLQLKHLTTLDTATNIYSCFVEVKVKVLISLSFVRQISISCWYLAQPICNISCWCVIKIFIISNLSFSSIFSPFLQRILMWNFIFLWNMFACECLNIFFLPSCVKQSVSCWDPKTAIGEFLAGALKSH